jgi:hypothetical protein
MLIRFCLPALALGTAALAAPAPITFHKDVLPLLQKNCQTCHRPGQAGPMSFLTYESTRPWAKAIKEALVSRRMPPWFADRSVGHFLNDPSLKQSEIDLVARWVDEGAPPGDRRDAPAPIVWPEGWQIQPDVVVQGPTYEVPAHPKNNVVEWISVTIPTGFAKDTWITSVEIKPEHPDVTHHMCVAFVPHNPGVQYFAPIWRDKQRDEDGSALPGEAPTFTGAGGVEDCYLPGNAAVDYRNLHAAKLIPAGSDIHMNLHYTPNGKAVTDHTRIGFTLAKEIPKRRYISFAPNSPTDAERFAIPPGDPNWQGPPILVDFRQDAEIVLMIPHMHARGKDMTYTLEYPDGRKELLLKVPRYDFNWQVGYQTSVHVPKGATLHVDAHFDNSPNNRFNPNPGRTVYFGEMTWEEMMAGFFSVVVAPDVDPKSIVVNRKGATGGA